MIATLFAAALAVTPIQQQPTHQQAMVCDANFVVALILYREMAEANPQDGNAAAGSAAAQAMMERARAARLEAAAREGISAEDSRAQTEAYAMANADAAAPGYQQTLTACMEAFGDGILSDEG